MPSFANTKKEDAQPEQAVSPPSDPIENGDQNRSSPDPVINKNDANGVEDHHQQQQQQATIANEEGETLQVSSAGIAANSKNDLSQAILQTETKIMTKLDTEKQAAVDVVLEIPGPGNTTNNLNLSTSADSDMEPPLPGMTSLSRNRRVGTMMTLPPGAYAAGPINAADTNDGLDPQDVENPQPPPPPPQQQQQQQRVLDSNLAVAQAVNDDATNLEDLQQAQPDDTATTAPARSNKSSTRVVGLFCCCGILFFLVIVGTGIAVAGRATTDNNENDRDDTPNNGRGIIDDAPPSGSPSMAPSQQNEVLIQYILDSVLPSYTTRTISEDNASPQAKALEWIIQDPMLEEYLNYTEEMEHGDDNRAQSSNTKYRRFLQRYALATFYYSVDGPDWNQHDDWLSYDLHECHWYARDKLAFDQPAFYEGQFTYLEDYDDMIDNRNPCELVLQGVPSTTNSTTTTAPTTNTKSLLDDSSPFQHLWLFGNNLQGTLPPQLSLLSSLRSISVYGNPGLRGSIPSEFGLWSGMESLGLAYTSISGTVPSQLGQMRRMHFFGLSANQLTGSIPTQLGLMSDTTTFIMDNNLLTGPIPDQLYDLTKLRTIYFWMDQLEGTVSTRVGQLTNLWDLSISNQFFYGTIPTQVGLMTRLERFTFYNNQFTGTISTEFGLMARHLRSLDLNRNDLTATIPSELGLLVDVHHFLLQENGLSGTIPPEVIALRSRPSLYSFNISNNENLVVPMKTKTNSSGSSQGDEPLIEECWVNQTFFELLCTETRTLPGSCTCSCTCDGIS